MHDPRRERIAGTFHTVEELMNLPEPEHVEPGKAREVSVRLPVRMWVAKEELVALLEESIECIRHNQEELATNAGDEADCAILIRQREVWLRHLAAAGEPDVFIALYPASPGGPEYDDEEAVTE